MKKFTLILLAIVSYTTIYSQTMNFYFPRFAGSDYNFAINRGSKVDTIQSGVINQDGRFSFTLPELHKDYKGIVRWSLAGGGQALIMNNENLSVSCMIPNPTENDIIFSNSPENDFLKKQLKAQQSLFNKIDIIYKAKEAYADNPTLSNVFDKEFGNLQNEYKKYYETNRESKFYAARYIEMMNFLNGLGDRLYTADEELPRAEASRDYIKERLNMDDLYSSGLWNHVISSSFGLFPGQAAFAEAMIKNLERIRSQMILEKFSTDLMTICSQYDWQEAEDSIVSYLLASKRIPNPQGILQIAFALHKMKPGTPAPSIPGIQNLKNTVLVFYESGCTNCITQMAELIKLYPQLQEKGIRIISLSADSSKEVFDYHSKDFPWENNLFDEKGFESDNFVRYSVVGTPTFYTIDEKELISGRHGKVEDIQKFLFN